MAAFATTLCTDLAELLLALPNTGQRSVKARKSM